MDNLTVSCLQESFPEQIINMHSVYLDVQSLSDNKTLFSFFKSNWKLSTRNIHLSSTWNPAPSWWIHQLSFGGSQAPRNEANLSGCQGGLGWITFTRQLEAYLDAQSHGPMGRFKHSVQHFEDQKLYWSCVSTDIYLIRIFQNHWTFRKKTIKSHANQWHGKMHWNHAFPTPGTGGYKFWRVS